MSGQDSMQRKIYSLEITVQPGDIDGLGHVNNVIYLKWVQDAAEAHWEAHAPEELKRKYKWVVLRHEIDYKSPAFAAQTIVATTWVENYQGAKSDRVVQLALKESQKLLAQAKTTWCLLDAVTMRPKRVESDISSVFSAG